MPRFHDPGRLPHRPLRPARLRPIDAARRARGEHHLGSRRRHGDASASTSASSAGSCSAARGAPACRSPTPKPIPSRVSELVLRGIFTLRRKELDWFYQEGASYILPEAFEEFVKPIPAGGARRPHRRLPPPPDRPRPRDVRLAAARAWSMWEGSALSLLPDPARVAAFGEPHYALAFARIEMPLLPERRFLRARRPAHRRRRYPPRTSRASSSTGATTSARRSSIAWDLHRAWPEADLRIVPDSGHAMTEPGIIHELVAATEKFKSRRK